MDNMQAMSDAFQAAAGFSGEDFNLYMKFLFVILTVLWSLELFSVWSFQSESNDLRALALRIVGVGVVLTIVMIMVSK